MLAWALGQHPELYCLHEPKPKLNAESFSHWTDSHSREKLRSKVALKRDNLVLQTHRQNLVYVESSYFLAHLIPYLDELYDARFIHLHRDGRHFVRSAFAQPWYIDDFDPLRFVKRWFRRCALVDVGASSEDHRLPTPERLESRFDKIAWLWAEVNGIISRELGKLPEERSLRIPLESLNDSAGFQRLLGFLGGRDDEDEVLSDMVATARDKPNKNANKDLPHPEEWSDDRVDRFEVVAGDMMRELGYSFR
jgi:hypothetical protein